MTWGDRSWSEQDRGFGDVQGAQDDALLGGGLGALGDAPGRAGELSGVHPVHRAGDHRPGQARGVLGDPDQHQGEVAQGDVGADPLLEAVVDGAELEDALEVAERAFGLEEALVELAASAAPMFRRCRTAGTSRRASPPP